MGDKSKVLKIHCNLLDQLTKKGNVPEAIESLLANYDVTKVTIMQNDNFQFFFCINNKEIAYNIAGVTRPLRVPIDTYDRLRRAKIYPEESFSSILFRLLAYDQKEEVKKPYILHAFIHPRDEWFDDKGDFKGFIDEYSPGPMLESNLFIEDIEELKKNPTINDRVEILITNCHEELELQNKYFSNLLHNDIYPLAVFKRTNDIGFPIYLRTLTNMEDEIVEIIECDDEADKFGFSHNEYREFIYAREKWEKKLQKVRKCKATKAANAARKKAEKVSENQ